MALLKILIFPDPRLRTQAIPIKTVNESIKLLAKDMLETMYEGKGIGLAATQVNIHKRIIVIDISENKNEPLILINPRVVRIIDPEEKSYSEGCLSVPGFFAEIKRPSSVEVSSLGINGKEEILKAEGLLSIVIQHEIDHLDGKMMVDFISNTKREMIRKKLVKAR